MFNIQNEVTTVNGGKGVTFVASEDHSLCHPLVLSLLLEYLFKG